MSLLHWFEYSFHWVIHTNYHIPKYTHTHTHHPWQAACSEAAQGCHIILNIHQLSRDIILAPHLHTAPTEWQTRDRARQERKRALEHSFLLSFRYISYMAAFYPSAYLFAPSISLSIPSNLLNWITTAGSAHESVCAHCCSVITSFKWKRGWISGGTMTTGPISDSPVSPMALFVSPYTPSHSLSLSNLRLLQSFLAYTSHLFYSPTF